MNVIRHLRAIVLLPGMVLLAVPAVLVGFEGGLKPGWTASFPISVFSTAFGALFLIGGLTLMTASIRLFAGIGQGTLAPWDPTRRLVVAGPYRHVRNPMISGVLFVLLGESLLLWSFSVFCWFCLFLAGNIAFIKVVEEPGLCRRFGEDYRAYRDNVPAWIPRIRPWTPPDQR